MKHRVTEVAEDGYAGLKIEGGQIVNYRTQNVDGIYAFNKLSRDNIDKGAVTRKGSWAMPIANIPVVEFQNLVRVNPDLQSTDAQIRTAAWLKLLRSPEGAQLRAVNRNLVPNHMRPDRGSIAAPHQEGETCPENSAPDPTTAAAATSKTPAPTVKDDFTLPVAA